MKTVTCCWYCKAKGASVRPSSNVKFFMCRTQCKSAKCIVWTHLHWVWHIKSLPFEPDLIYHKHVPTYKHFCGQYTKANLWGATMYSTCFGLEKYVPICPKGFEGFVSHEALPVRACARYFYIVHLLVMAYYSTNTPERTIVWNRMEYSYLPSCAVLSQCFSYRYLVAVRYSLLDGCQVLTINDKTLLRNRVSWTPEG